VLPFHSFVFPGLLRGLVDDAESIAAGRAIGGEDGVSGASDR